MPPTTRRRKKPPKLEPTPSLYSDIADSETVCSVCLAEFLDPEDLQVHTAQMHEVQPFSAPISGHTCNFCLETMPSLDLYLSHIIYEHFASMRCCMYCSRGFIDAKDLKEHESKHTVKKDIYSCSQCKILFSNVDALEAHEVQMHSSSKEGVILKSHYPLLSTLLCSKAETFVQSLGRDAIYVCGKCKLQTTELDVYLKHLKKMKCRVFACSECSVVCPMKLHMVQHLRFHPECNHGYDPLNKKQMKKCKECKKLISIEDFKMHIKGCKILKCLSCDMTFESVGKLSEHQASEHPLSVMLKCCRYCNQELVGSANLFKHMEHRHRKEYHLYKYNCVHCRSIFKHPKKLLGHIFSKHRDLKPFSCKVCNENFRMRKPFTIHIKMKHNSEGFVEFDESMNVFFTDKKSEKPYQPPENPSLYNEEEMKEGPPEPAETECETDPDSTDIEKPKKKVTKKSAPKAKKAVKSYGTDVNTDVASETDGRLATETETDLEDSKKKVLIKKRKTLIKDLVHSDDDSDDSSDNQPLLVVRKRVKSTRKLEQSNVSRNRRKTKLSMEKRRLTCNICKKFCYTRQNYDRHVTMHFKNESKQCIKCAKLFSSNKSLESHMKTDHATTHITATLRKLLEKRNIPVKCATDKLSNSQKFGRTVKKVDIPKCTTTAAKITAAQDKNSVKKFLETFTPDVADANKGVSVNSMVTIKIVEKAARKPKIVVTKFREAEKPKTTSKSKLQMPKKFNRAFSENINGNVKVTLQVHQGTVYRKKPKLNYGRHVAHASDEEKSDDEKEKNFDFYETEYQDDNYTYDDVDEAPNETIIPDVAEEIMLENDSEEVVKQTTQLISHKMVIPKRNAGQKFQIAHLLPQAPYFRIVPFENLMPDDYSKDEVKDDKEQDIRLPSGTKLVHANPLAHLLGNKTLEELSLRKRGKYYKYKPRVDYPVALAKAMLDLEKPITPPIKRQRKPKTVMLKPTPATSKRRKIEP